MRGVDTCFRGVFLGGVARTLSLVRSRINRDGTWCEVQQFARSWRRDYLNRTVGDGLRAAKELAELY